jgi:hypothetical protein
MNFSLLSVPSLDARTSAFRARDVVTDGSSVFEATASGLTVRLSELLAGAPANGRRSIAVFADTFIIDRPRLDVSGAVVFARVIDISEMAAPKLMMGAPSSDAAILEVLAQESTGPLTVQPDGASASWSPPLGIAPLRAGFFVVDSGGKGTASTNVDPSALADVVSRSWALSSLRASVTAATYLSSSSNAADIATARSMLGWVVACVSAYAKSGPLPSDYAELYYQAAGLLVTLTTASGAIFVPVLSATFYRDQVSTLVAAVAAYEGRIADLDAASDLQATLAKLGAAFEGAAQDEAAPLQTQLKTIADTIDALNASLTTLQLQFLAQQSDCGARLAVMQAKIMQMQGAQFLVAALKGIVEYYMIGASIALIAVDPAAGPAAAKEAMKSALEIGEKAIAEIEKNGRDIAGAAAAAGGDKDLLSKSEAMITAQMQMVAAVQSGLLLWASGPAGASGTALPAAMATVSIDPALAWNSWMAVVEAKMSNVIAGITGDFAEAAKDAAADYVASLRILAEYGKAIGAKTVTLAGQLAQGSLVRAQIAAALNTAARWKQLQDQAHTDQERKAAMRSLLQARSDAIKRSVFLSWSYYRASYMYLYFAAPPVTLTVDMNAAQLADQVAAMSQWIGRLLGETADGATVKLPANDVAITLRFEIVPQGGRADGSIDQALLVRGADQLWRLTWAVPIGTPQLRGVLPDQGNVAVWIKEARFIVSGITPNNRGNVLANVAVSGAYQNGFAPDDTFRFVSKGLDGDYGYAVQTGATYIRWTIDPAVYTTPTPFTQWTMVFDADGGDPSAAQALEMQLTVAYSRKP